MNTGAFYRIHWNFGVIPFDAEHAYSHIGGLAPLDDTNSTHACIPCGGTGDLPPHLGGNDDGTCPDCDGDGAIDADRGYSCCGTPDDLLAVPAQFGAGAEALAAARVIEFEGDVEGYGADGEPLVTPTRVIRVMTWDEFTAVAQ